MENVALVKTVREAVELEGRDRVTALLQRDSAFLNMKPIVGIWIHAAVDFGKFEVLKCLIPLGVNINTRAGIFG
jgi:hypothetical protein